MKRQGGGGAQVEPPDECRNMVPSFTGRFEVLCCDEAPCGKCRRKPYREEPIDDAPISTSPSSKRRRSGSQDDYDFDKEGR